VRRLELPIEWGRAAISEPPRRAVVVAAQCQLLLVNLETETANVIFSGLVIESVAISADGAWAVTTAVPPDWDYFEHDWNGPRTFRLFDLKRRSCVRTWKAHRAVITDLALNADGRFLATASRDQTAQLFDLHKGSTLGSWRCAREVEAVALTPAGHRVAYVSRGGVLTVRRRSGIIVGRFAHCGAEPGCVALSEDGCKVVMGIGGDVSVVDLKKAKRHGPFSGPQPYLTSLVIDGEASHAITGEMGPQLVLWDLTRPHKAESAGQRISGIWASSGKALVHQDSLSLWDLSTGECVQIRPPGNFEVVPAPTAGVWALTKWSATGGGRIRIGKWGRRQTTLFIQSRDLTRGMITSMQLSRNGERLLTLVHRMGCRILNLPDSGTVWQQKEMGLGVRPFLSPSGRYVLLCCLDGKTEIVDLDTQEVIQHLQLQPNTGRVLFGADDNCIFIEQGSDTVLFNWRTGSSHVLCSGGPSSVSDDARWLITESNTRKLGLWILPEERRVATFTLDAPVLHTALSPDGRFLIAGDVNGGVHILQRQG
jgi:WD40 repeat protein